MARSAYLPIPADRYEACVRQIRFRGFDLRDVPLRAQCRLSRGTPGAPLFDLQTTTNGNAEGLRVVEFVLDGIVPVTTIEFIVNETTMEALPYAGERGGDTVLEYDLQATIAGRKRKLIYGEFPVIDGVTGADDAPTSRPGGYGGGHRWGAWSSREVTFAGDVAQVTLEGVDLLDPLFGYLIASKAADRARMEARSLLYGVSNGPDARLFAAEATELAFADDYYREGYLRHDELYQTAGWAINGTQVVIDGAGLPISGDTAPVLYRESEGDVTFVVEADLPAHDGVNHVIASYVGPAIENRVAVYRNDAGIYALQVYNNEQGLQVVAGPQDLTARTMRVAVTIGRGDVRASFAGAPAVKINATRPAQLLRLWLGTLAQGYGDVLGGRIRRLAFLPYAVSNGLLQAMSGGPVTDDEVTQLIDQKIRTHDNNNDAHDLEAVRRQGELADSKIGLWTIKAADTFTGADGSALGNAETGGMAWVTNSCVRKGGRLQQPAGVSGGAWLQSGTKDGQVEADLYPGTKEASLYVRMNAAFQQWILLQRNADGGITLNIQFGGQTIRLAPLLVLPVVAGERFKVRFIGPRVWVFRVVAGAENLLFDITETRLMTETYHGMRLDGGGSADNFRVLNREAI